MKVNVERITQVTVSITGTPQQINTLHFALARLTDTTTLGSTRLELQTAQADAQVVKEFTAQLGVALIRNERGGDHG